MINLKFIAVLITGLTLGVSTARNPCQTRPRFQTAADFWKLTTSIMLRLV